MQQQAILSGEPVLDGEIGRPLRSIKPSIPENLVSDIVSRQDRRPQRSRIGVGDGYIHVSSLVDVCARKEVLSNRYREEAYKSVSSFDRLMWKYGRVAEKHMRDAVIAATNGRSVYGKWACLCGSLKHTGMRPAEKVKCDNCGLSAFNYYEYPIRNDEYKIIGSCDLPLMHNGYLIPIECKSMNYDQWVQLLQPLGDHITQVALYRWLYKEAGWNVHNMSSIVYVVKEYKFKTRKFPTPYKEFHIDCESEDVLRMVEIALEEAATIRDALSENFIPRRVCGSVTESRAKACPMAHLCFSLSG